MAAASYSIRTGLQKHHAGEYFGGIIFWRETRTAAFCKYAGGGQKVGHFMLSVKYKGQIAFVLTDENMVCTAESTQTSIPATRQRCLNALNKCALSCVLPTWRSSENVGDPCIQVRRLNSVRRDKRKYLFELERSSKESFNCLCFHFVWSKRETTRQNSSTFALEIQERAPAIFVLRGLYCYVYRHVDGNP